MDDLYDGSKRETWMNGLSEMDKHNTSALLTIFARLGLPKSYLDVGCGTGAMVKTARLLGIEAYGVDQLVDETWPSYFFHANLVDKFTLPAPVEMITSFEVGEHLHESAHATFCDTLCNNLEMGSGHHLVFSAARPGQQGTGHIALRPASYWHEQFLLRGLSYNGHLTMNLALLLSNINIPLNYLWDNLIVFSR